MGFRYLAVAHDGGVGTITLIRPPINAINGQVLDETVAALEAWEADPAVTAVVVTGGIRMIQPELETKGIQLSVDLDANPCPMRGDSGRLQQVVWNLLNNAAKFTSTGGQVRVSLTCQGPDNVLTVTDTGIGIPPDFMPYVFEQFRQGHQSGTSGGLGLGLAIARNIVELHSGHIEAHSDGVGRGATFTVRLPATS